MLTPLTFPSSSGSYGEDVIMRMNFYHVKVNKSLTIIRKQE
jgi:hypothetical protein